MLLKTVFPDESVVMLNVGTDVFAGMVAGGGDPATGPFGSLKFTTMLTRTATGVAPFLAGSKRHFSTAR
jgi:hypothetical protein